MKNKNAAKIDEVQGAGKTARRRTVNVRRRAARVPQRSNSQFSPRSSCIFCKIVAREIPANIVYEDETTLAFLDINPVNPGHTLVIPKKHSYNILDIAPKDWAAVAETARTMAIVLHDALLADGINLGMNNREHAGQVVDHPHVHVMPRHKGDGFALWHGKPYKEGEAAEVAAKIRLLTKV